MRNIFLLYMPPGNRQAMVNYENTIRNRVSLDRVGKLLTRLEIANLQHTFASRPFAVWGSRDSDRNRGAFDRMSPGDDVLIVEGPTVKFVGKVALKTVNPRLSAELWKSLDGASVSGWDLIYFIANPVEISVPFDQLCGLLGYQPGFQLRGFTPVAADRLEAFSAQYGDLYSALQRLNSGEQIRQIELPVNELAAAPPLEHEDGAELETLTPSEHVRIQWTLARLGRAAGEKVWVPRGDQGRLKRTYQFDEFESEFAAGIDLPKNTFENIDVVWREEFRINAAFEVENSTAIYSGLLRFADLSIVAPNSPYPMFIVAPSERRNQVRDQLRRPAFSRLDLRRKVRFLSYEAVDEIDRFFAGTRSGLSVDVLNGRGETLV